MRVISGLARGTKLYSLEGIATRPTLDRVKESLFNIIHAKMEDAIVLDLFAGSGALGIECASRGAKKVYLCDKSKQAICIIEKNVEKTKLQEKITILNGDYKTLLTKLETKCDLIFLDPPYATDLAIEGLKEIVRLDLLEDTGMIVLETDEEENIVNQLKKLNLKVSIYDIRKYGRVSLIFLNRKG